MWGLIDHRPSGLSTRHEHGSLAPAAALDIEGRYTCCGTDGLGATAPHAPGCANRT